jgi:hypothetical protein
MSGSRLTRRLCGGVWLAALSACIGVERPAVHSMREVLEAPPERRAVP